MFPPKNFKIRGKKYQNVVCSKRSSVGAALLFSCMMRAKFPLHTAGTEYLVRKILILTRDTDFNSSAVQALAALGADGISLAHGNNYLGREGLLHARSNISLKLKPPTNTFQTLAVICFGEYALSYISFCTSFSNLNCNHKTYSPANWPNGLTKQQQIPGNIANIWSSNQFRDPTLQATSSDFRQAFHYTTHLEGLTHPINNSVVDDLHLKSVE